MSRHTVIASGNDHGAALPKKESCAGARSVYIALSLLFSFANAN